MASSYKLSNEECIAIGVAVGIALFDKKKRPKKKWSKNWLLQRKTYCHMNLIRELRENEKSDFLNYLRMDECRFSFLLNLVTPEIEKQNTVMREAVSAEERLIVTLRYLATGRNYEDLKFSCAISPQLLGRIIPETCWAIYRVLKEEYIKVSYSFILIIQSTEN